MCMWITFCCCCCFILNFSINIIVHIFTVYYSSRFRRKTFEMPAQSTIGCSHFILISVCVILTLSNNVVVGNINQPTTTLATDSANHTGNDTEHEDHGIHIVSWRFSELSGPIIISIFMLAVSILKVSKYQEYKI